MRATWEKIRCSLKWLGEERVRSKSKYLTTRASPFDARLKLFLYGLLRYRETRILDPTNHRKRFVIWKRFHPKKTFGNRNRDIGRINWEEGIICWNKVKHSAAFQRRTSRRRMSSTAENWD